MGKRILLIGGNFYPEPTGIGKYNAEMIDWLSENDYSCTVITTFPYYPHWKVQSPYSKSSWWYKKEVRIAVPGSLPITIIRCPHYVPKSPSGIKRMASDLSFFITAYITLLTFLFQKKYDVVINVAPPFQLGLLGVLYKKIKGAKFVCHIQDLQIDAAGELGILKSKPFLRLLFRVEKYILTRADEVSSISAGMVKKVQNKCGKEVSLFPNWADLVNFHPVTNANELKESFGFSSSNRIVLYSGSIGHKQGLDAMLHAAAHFKENADLKFVICGCGPYKDRLLSIKDDLKLENVLFHPLQPSGSFNSFLNIADVHLILQKGNARDLVMPSKLTTIFAAGGLVIVTAVAGTSLHEVISSGTGILIPPDDQAALHAALSHALETNHQGIKRNARRYAEEHFFIDTILNKFSTCVLNEVTAESRMSCTEAVISRPSISNF